MLFRSGAGVLSGCRSRNSMPFPGEPGRRNWPSPNSRRKPGVSATANSDAPCGAAAKRASASFPRPRWPPGRLWLPRPPQTARGFGGIIPPAGPGSARRVQGSALEALQSYLLSIAGATAGADGLAVGDAGPVAPAFGDASLVLFGAEFRGFRRAVAQGIEHLLGDLDGGQVGLDGDAVLDLHDGPAEIGRASCRERV